MSVSTHASGNQGQTVTAPRLEAALRSYILERSGWKGENLDLRLASFTPVALPAGALRLRVLRTSAQLAPGPQTFHLSADVGGKEEARFSARADLKLLEQVVVAAHPLAYRELLETKDVRVERRELSSPNVKPFMRIEDVVGKQTARAVADTEILTHNMLERPTLIRRGSSITLVYETSGLRVESPGLAEEGGKAGDFIQVKNPASGKAMRGEVVDERTVKVN
jgi:flagella basal body P-ring formation protein FlgA